MPTALCQMKHDMSGIEDDAALPQVPTTIVLDFDDSYTRNTLVLFKQLDELQRKGEKLWDMRDWKRRVIVINVAELSWDIFTSEILPHAACIVLGPGPGTPHKENDFSWPTRLIAEYGETIPIFGICLGLQGIATAFGGQVAKAMSPIHGQISRIAHNEDAFFNGIPKSFSAVQYNSLAVVPESVPDELEVLAYNEREEVMALRHKTRPIWGVQFHPESICSTYGSTMLSNFLRASIPFTRARSLDSRLPFPEHVLVHSTSNVGSTFSLMTNGSPSQRWHQRSVRLPTPRVVPPQQAFEALVKGRSPLGDVWLDSARSFKGENHFSHIFSPAATLSYNMADHQIEIRTPTACDQTELREQTSFFDYFADLQRHLQDSVEVVDHDSPSVPIGFTGSFPYELKSQSLRACPPRADKSEAGTDAIFAFANSVLTFAHETEEWVATALVRSEDSRDDAWVLNDGQFDRWIEEVERFFACPRSPSHTPPLSSPLPPFEPDASREDYIAAIRAAQELIVAGDSYELNLTTTFRSQLPLSLAKDPYPAYLALRAGNPAPYSAYFRLPL